MAVHNLGYDLKFASTAIEIVAKHLDDVGSRLVEPPIKNLANTRRIVGQDRETLPDQLNSFTAHAFASHEKTTDGVRLFHPARSPSSASANVRFRT